MQIRNMFAEDINRPINGVIKVDQDSTDVIEQEVREYIITRELKTHFNSFFRYYSNAFDTPTSDVGVWISGFFGSGKSHFLKMLSYILENKDIDGTPTVEMFRKKLADDPECYALIERATRGKTETILFNIDIEGSITKDKTAVIRVFAKMFYSHLGFYGENLKVAMLEQYIDQNGKTEEFRRVFEEKKGKSWVDQRKAFAFNGKFIIPTLMEVLDMPEEDARSWFNDKSAVDFSIARLTEDIKAYVDSRPDDFRLLFMIDEVGQYVGTDTDMLLNLQSIIEKVGSDCGGKVWIMCTGQEAIDEIIKVRADEFSRIRARFKTTLSLSSSSADEVIQKRVLLKTDEAKDELSRVYTENDSVLRNLFSFRDCVLDIKGFTSEDDYIQDYPFVPYQFILLQKMFAEIRKHGNAGKNISGGERSMLSGFQEAAQKIQLKDEYALAPLHLFYDTVHSFLEGSIRRVIERCELAAQNGDGIEPQDVNVLKLLYLVRYVDDVRANLDNIVIMMADDIRLDKITMREQIRGSLDRLFRENYIGRTGEVYNFLTDEEQDIAKDIKNTMVDTSSIVERISQMIFADIYTTRKFRYGRYDFDFDKMVDGQASGSVTGGMKLKFITVATDAHDKEELTLMANSRGQAIVVLADTPYYDSLESAMKIRKYVKQRNVSQLARSIQEIIREYQDEAGRYELAAMDELKKAIEKAEFYVDGEHLDIKGGDAKAHVDQAMEYLVSHVYSELDLVRKNADTDADILNVLTAGTLPDTDPNRDAAAKVEEYLQIQERNHLSTSMFDVQSRYQGIPYGWREIDIAAVVALLINWQKVTIKYGGNTIQPGDPRLTDMLRKRSEIGKTAISIRKIVSAARIRRVRALLREYFSVMDVPEDEDGLVRFIIDSFNERKVHYEELNDKYKSGHNYPDRSKVQNAVALMTDILSQRTDNIALIDRVIDREEELFDSKEDLQNVEDFFKSKVQVFDAAARLAEDLRNELDYLVEEPEANDALKKIRLIVMVQGGFSYDKVPELNELMATVRGGHKRLLDAKRSEVMDIANQCMGAIYEAAGSAQKTKDRVESAESFYEQKRRQIRELDNLALIDGLIPPMLQYKDNAISNIESILAPPVEPPKKEWPASVGEKSADIAAAAPEPPQTKKVIKPFNRQILFPAGQLESEKDIDEYVDRVRKQLKNLLQSCDGIKIK